VSIRVLLLTQWFDPEPTFKGLVFARELIKQGFEVEVLTGFPNYPGGKIYPGYRVKLLQRECIEGVQITRIPLYPSHDKSAKGRILNYVSFAASSLFYGLFSAKRPDVIYAYHPPLTVGIVAAFIRIFRRVPVVYDIQDLWPDTLLATGMLSNKKVLGLVSRICDWVYKKMDHLVVLSPGFKRKLIERGVPEQKIEVIYNWCAENAVSNTSSALPVDFFGEEKFCILFAGNMGKAQALDAVLRAAEILQSQLPQLAFIFLGTGLEVDRLKQLATDMRLNNVLFLPAVPMEEVGAYLQAADVLLVHLKKDELFRITIPSKTQAYMAAGKPILMAVDGDAAALVELGQCGLTAEPENPAAIAEAVLHLMQCSVQERERMANNAKKYYHENLSLKAGSRRFAEIFSHLAKNNESR